MSKEMKLKSPSLYIVSHILIKDKSKRIGVLSEQKFIYTLVFFSISPRRKLEIFLVL